MGFCQNCGAELLPGMKTCAMCGAPSNLKRELPRGYRNVPPVYPDPVPMQQQQAPYPPPSYPVYPPPQAQPYADPMNRPQAVTGEPAFSDWLLWTFLGLIPFANLVILGIWAFSETTLPVKKNWARAMFLCMAVLTGIVLLILSIRSAVRYYNSFYYDIFY